jgi:hypothetical protein
VLSVAVDVHKISFEELNIAADAHQPGLAKNVIRRGVFLHAGALKTENQV